MSLHLFPRALHANVPAGVTQRASGWLWLTVPIAVLVAVISVIGMSVPNFYHDSPVWAIQVVAQAGARVWPRRGDTGKSGVSGTGNRGDYALLDTRGAAGIPRDGRHLPDAVSRQPGAADMVRAPNEQCHHVTTEDTLGKTGPFGIQDRPVPRRSCS